MFTPNRGADPWNDACGAVGACRRGPSGPRFLPTRSVGRNKALKRIVALAGYSRLALCSRSALVRASGMPRWRWS